MDREWDAVRRTGRIVRIVNRSRRGLTHRRRWACRCQWRWRKDCLASGRSNRRSWCRRRLEAAWGMAGHRRGRGHRPGDLRAEPGWPEAAGGRRVLGDSCREHRRPRAGGQVLRAVEPGAQERQGGGTTGPSIPETEMTPDRRDPGPPCLNICKGEPPAGHQPAQGTRGGRLHQIETIQLLARFMAPGQGTHQRPATPRARPGPPPCSAPARPRRGACTAGHDLSGHRLGRRRGQRQRSGGDARCRSFTGRGLQRFVRGAEATPAGPPQRRPTSVSEDARVEYRANQGGRLSRTGGATQDRRGVRGGAPV